MRNHISTLREFLHAHERLGTSDAIEAVNAIDAFLTALGEDLIQLHTMRFNGDWVSVTNWVNDKGPMLTGEIAELYGQHFDPNQLRFTAAPSIIHHPSSIVHSHAS